MDSTTARPGRRPGDAHEFSGMSRPLETTVISLHGDCHDGAMNTKKRPTRRQETAAISSAHGLLTNNVLACNTSRMNDVVGRLNRGGVGIEEDWLRRIGPAHFSHINFRESSDSTSRGVRRS